MKRILLCTALLASYVTATYAMEEKREEGAHVSYPKPDRTKLKEYVAENISDALKNGNLTYKDKNGTWKLSEIKGYHGCQYWKQRIKDGETIYLQDLSIFISSLELNIHPLYTVPGIYDWDYNAWDKKSFRASIAEANAELITFRLTKKD